ncbi:MAG: thioesterase [Cyanobacteria bacterium]|nr:thioesterase [Cyanobacteriota bacterium]
MKPGLKIGAIQRWKTIVDETMMARFHDGLVHPLYGTSTAVQHMEWVSRQHILPYLEPGEEGMGSEVWIQHKASAAIGTTIEITAEVSEITPKFIRCETTIVALESGLLLATGFVVQALVRRKLP